MVQLSGIPKTSVYRMVGSLEDMGFLTREADGKYVLGLLFLQFGQLVSERLDMRNLAVPLMRELRDDIGEAVNLIIPDGKEAMYIEKVDTLQPVRVYTRIGRRAPLYAGACPRILLAFLPIDKQTQYLSETKLLPIASGTITDLAELEQILDDSRRNGYSVSHHELEDGTAAVAAPVFDFTGQVIAGLSVAGPAARFQDEHLPDLIQKVKTFANQLSNQMGWNGGVIIRNA